MWQIEFRKEPANGLLAKLDSLSCETEAKRKTPENSGVFRFWGAALSWSASWALV
jgi:hypothetical protein